MTRPSLTPHDRHGVLVLSRRVAEALAAKALDPASTLPRPVRVALAVLVVAVDVEACRRVGVEPPGPELRAVLEKALADLPEARPP